MRTLLRFLPILLLTSCATSPGPEGSISGGGRESGGTQTLHGPRGRYVPTPAMAVEVYFDKDPRGWQMQHLDGDRNGIVLEFVLKGDSIGRWKEMVAQQIVFTKNPLRRFADGWTAALARTDPAAQSKETIAADGSIITDYRSDVSDEIGVRKFMQGPDGIYMVAYHCRKASKNDGTYKLWTEIVSGSNLIPNPQMKK